MARLGKAKSENIGFKIGVAIRINRLFCFWSLQILKCDFLAIYPFNRIGRIVLGNPNFSETKLGHYFFCIIVKGASCPQPLGRH
jgi:hypothetical protein